MRSLLLFLALFVTSVTPAGAQWMAGLSLTNMVLWPPLHLNLTTPVRTQAGPQAAERVHPLLVPAGNDLRNNARQLSAQFPAGRRVELEQAFVKSMDVYAQVMRKLGIPERDMAASLAAYIAGNYMVMNEADVPDEVFQALARQLREQDSLRTMSKGTGPSQLRALYEQSAMVGAFMTLTWKAHQQSPQPPEIWGNVRDTARANLQAVLQTDPATLRLDKSGMRLQPVARLN